MGERVRCFSFFSAAARLEATDKARSEHPFYHYPVHR